MVRTANRSDDDLPAAKGLKSTKAAETAVNEHDARREITDGFWNHVLCLLLLVAELQSGGNKSSSCVTGSSSTMYRYYVVDLVPPAAAAGAAPRSSLHGELFGRESPESFLVARRQQARRRRALAVGEDSAFLHACTIYCILATRVEHKHVTCLSLLERNKRSFLLSFCCQRW